MCMNNKTLFYHIHNIYTIISKKGLQIFLFFFIQIILVN